jgi:hypothetical protein
MSPLPPNLITSGSSGHLSVDGIPNQEMGGDMDLMIGHSPTIGSKIVIEGPPHLAGMGGGFYTSRPVTSGGAFPRRQ